MPLARHLSPIAALFISPLRMPPLLPRFTVHSCTSVHNFLISVGDDRAIAMVEVLGTLILSIFCPVARQPFIPEEL